MPDLLRDFNDLVGNTTPAESSGDVSVNVIENVPDIIDNMRKQMLKAADELNFEEAARLRDRIKKLEEMSITEMS